MAHPALKNPVFRTPHEQLAEKLPETTHKHLTEAFNASIDPAVPTPETHTRAIRFEVNRRIGNGTLGT